MPSIRWLEVQAKNAYSYASFEMPLDQQGLVLVRGLNLDDGGFLGAGKTSPFEVFAGVQTGRVGKQRKGERHLADDVVNLQAGQDYEARVRVEVDGKPYDIVHCRKHQRWGNAYRVVDVDTGRNILPNDARQHPQAWVMQNLLHVDEKSFFNLVYMAQDFSNAMLTGTDGDRQQSLVQMFGLDVYDHLLRTTKQRLVAYGKVVQDVDELKRELLEIETQIQQFSTSVDALVNDIAAKRAEALQLQNNHDVAVDKSSVLQDLLRKLEARAQHRQEIDRLWGLVEIPLENPSAVTKKLCRKVRRKADGLADEASELRNTIRLLDQRHVIEKRLENIVARDEDEVQEEMDAVREKLRVLTNDTLPKSEQRAELVADLRKLQRPTEAAADLQERLDQARAERQHIEQELHTVEAKLAKGVCPTCHRPLDMDAGDVKAAKKQQAQLRKSLGTAADSVHTLSTQVATARQYETIKQSLQQIGSVADPVSVQKEISRLSKEERRLVSDLEGGRIKATLETQLAAMPKASPQKLTQRLTKVEAAVERYRRQHEVVTALLRELVLIRKLPKGDVKEVRGRLRKTLVTIKNSTDRIMVVSTEVANAERTLEQLKTLTARRTKITKGLNDSQTAQTEIKCLQALERAFGSKGLKRDRFNAILRDAAEQTVPQYTKLLWPKRTAKLTLDEEGNAVKVDLARGKLRTGSRLLSGGERNKAGLALLFGMRDLKERYTALNTNVLIVDEPFGNLDVHGTQCLLQVLQGMKQRFGSIFVIGNQSDVLNSAVWDQTWWAVRENQTSVLYREGLPKRYRTAVDRYAAAD